MSWKDCNQGEQGTSRKNEKKIRPILMADLE